MSNRNQRRVMYSPSAMSGAPTPPPVIIGEEPQPRSLLGWLVSGVLVLLTVVAAVEGYVTGDPQEDTFEGLQTQLKYEISLKEAKNGPFSSALGKVDDKDLKRLVSQATEGSASSDEAAQIAVVAAREAGEEVPKVALRRLARSKDRTSQLMSRFYSGDDVALSLIDQIEESGDDRTALRLARVQAQESADLPSARGSVADQWFPVRLGLFMLAGLAALAAGLVVLVWFFKARARGVLRPVGLAAYTKGDGDRLMARFAGYFIVFNAVGLAFSGLDMNVWGQAAALVLVGLVSVGLVAVPWLGKADSPRLLVGATRRKARLVGLGLLGYLCALPFVAAVLYVSQILVEYLPAPNHPISKDMASAGPSDWVAIALTAVVIAPLIEEFFFRGVLLPSLAAHFKRALWPILVCGLVFASIHPQGPLIWPALVAIGSASAYLRYYSGSLVPSFTLHVTHNGVIIFMSLMLG